MPRIKTISKSILWLTLIAALPLTWANADALQDWVKLINYKPSTAVSALAQQDNFTSYARRIFYVNRPKIAETVAVFRADCTDSEQTIVLGCYHSGESGISLYDVKDARLQGILQVTAAHEMLHGAYERLSTKDRKNVDAMLQSYYLTVTDQRIIDTVNAYKQTEPADVVNEMHSIFGTEIAQLPANLETYYQKYFTNRLVVTTYANKYQSEFTSRSNQISNYDSQLAQLKATINTEEQSLTSSLSQITADRARLDSLQSANSISEYNALVPVFNREVDNYNAGVSKLKKDIASYNSIVVTRNAIADQLQTLDSSIDTRLTTQ